MTFPNTERKVAPSGTMPKDTPLVVFTRPDGTVVVLRNPDCPLRIKG